MLFVVVFSHLVMSVYSATLWTLTRQAPLIMGLPRQEYWSGLPFPSPADVPNPGIKPASPALAGGCFTTEPPRKPIYTFTYGQIMKMGQMLTIISG